jgi:hypothetical protein
MPLAGFVLSGHSDGKLGFLYREYFFRNGKIVVDCSSEVFAPPVRNILVTNTDRLGPLSKIPGIFTADDPVQAVRRILSMQRDKNPETGGPDQVVQIDQTGSRWIERPTFACASALTVSAIGTRELTTGELLVGLGGGKPTKFKVVDGFGQWVAFAGYDPTTGFTGFAAVNARIGPDINNPSFYCDGTGAWLQNVPLSFSNASLTTIIDSAYDSLFGVWASFKTHVTPDPLHPELGGAYPTYIAPGGIACAKSTVDSTALWALSTSGLFLFDVSAPTNPLHAAALYPWINGSPALYLAGDRVMGPRKTGWSAATGTATRTSFATTTVTLPQLAERVKAIIDDFLGHGSLGA